MKRFYIYLLIAVVGVFTSCLKPKHSVRVQNNYAVALRVIIGPNDYGAVGSGVTTSYKSIPEGSHTISGDVTGSMTVKGKGKHNWTVNVSSSGIVTLKEDK